MSDIFDLPSGAIDGIQVFTNRSKKSQKKKSVKDKSVKKEYPDVAVSKLKILVNLDGLAPSLKEPIDDFIRHIKILKKYSENTVLAYTHSIRVAVTLFQINFANKKIKWTNWSQISVKDISDYLYDLFNLKLTKSTIKARQIGLNVFFMYLLKNDVLKFNPILKSHSFRPAYRLPPMVNVDTAIKLVDSFYNTKDHIEFTYFVILEILFTTGMRISETLGLTYDDLDVEDRQIVIMGKGGKERVVPLPIKLSNHIKRFIKGKDKIGHVFTLDDQPICRKKIHRIMQQRCNKLGIEPLSPHKLRHCFATQVLIKSGNLRLVQELLGHSSIKSTQVYTNLDLAQLRKSYKKYHPLENQKKK